jgi:ABC-type dipeptide/oligopeptide/nickel transport system permease component
MASYIIRRLIGALIVLIGISIITFLIAFAVPGDPVRAIVGQKATAAVVEQVRHTMGLDKPLYIQYFIYMGHLLHGNLGFSYYDNENVTTLIFQRLGASAQLAFGGWIVELLIGIPLGVLTAVKNRKLTDYVVSILGLIGVSLPVFWFGMWLIYNVSYKMGILPLGGSGGFQNLILPSLTLGVAGAAFND